MLSIIICSVNPSLLHKIKLNISHTVGVEHEVIIIDNITNTYSIAQAYNIGAAKSKYSYLCFCHEDIAFYTKNWGKILIDTFIATRARLIGVLGCIVRTKIPSSVYIYTSHFNRQNQLQRHPSGRTILCNENPFNESYSEVCTLDGLFIASTKQAWMETKFSEEYLIGFHGYDIDFSIKNYFLGKVIVTFNILLEHFSFGLFSMQWVNAQLLLTQIWKAKLPLQIAGSKDRINLAEILCLKEFLKILINNNYQRKLQLYYFIKLFIKAPLDPLNTYFIRKIFLGNSLDNKFKFCFKRLAKP